MTISSDGTPPPQRPEPGQLRELARTQNYSLGRPFHIRLTPQGDRVFFLRAMATRPVADLFAMDLPGGRVTRVLSAQTLLDGRSESLSAAEKAERERKRIKTSGFTGFQLAESGDRMVLKLGGEILLYDPLANRWARLELPKGTFLTPKLSPDGLRLAFVWNHDLAMVELPDELPENHLLPRSPAKLTTDGTAKQPYGTAEFVAQEEMSRYVGFWWAPDGRSIVFQQSDERGVEHLSIADAARPEKAPHQFAYPRPGRDNVDLSLFRVELDSGEHQQITWPKDLYPYLASVTWEENGPLTLLFQSRNQQKQAYMRVDLTKHEARPLFEEHDPTWLNIHHSTPHFLKSGTEFLWASEESGHWRVELKTLADNGLSVVNRKVIIPESAGFRDLLSVHEDEGWVYFSGGQDPAQQHIYRTRLNGDQAPVALTDTPGWYDAQVARNRPVLAITQATLSSLPETRVFTLNETKLSSGPVISNEAESPTRIPEVELIEPEHAGGFRAAVVRPKSFNPKKKYPVVMYVYGGPGTHVVRANMAYWFMQQWIADHGFVVISIDGRGTPHRGREFERAIYKKFHEVPLHDQVVGLKALANHMPFLDLQRVGVYGWSFGGYMSALAVLRRPDVFAVGVAGAPVVDWMYYDTHYTERYLGVPTDDDHQAYDEGNLLTYTPQLKQPLMLIHGVADDNVYFAHSLQLADALFRAGKNFRFIPLAGATHQVVGAELREALYGQIVQFLGQELWDSTKGEP
ncbi:MAG: DPP IV N-terminal domain-containing protein [Myxococcales bacterium]|nr:DPP IV N-terminal domain-containing protein [Myxococcales bacterium]